jgi:hypothetical protein
MTNEEKSSSSLLLLHGNKIYFKLPWSKFQPLDSDYGRKGNAKEEELFAVWLKIDFLWRISLTKDTKETV